MTNKKQIMKGTLGATALTVLLSGTAFAQVTPNDFTLAGTPVSNTFTLDYSVGGVVQPPIDSSDPNDPNGPTVFTVDRLVNLNVESQGDNTVSPGSINQDLVFSVLNTGNDTQGYSLRIVEETAAPDDLDTDAPTSNVPLTVFIDDGDGIFDPAVDVGTPYDPANPPQLAPDEIFFVVVQQDIPSDAIDLQRADITLVADTLDAGGVVETVADNDGVNALLGDAENFLADGSSTSNEAAGAGDDSSTGTFIIAAADIEAIKTVTVFSQDGTNCATIPGTAVGGFGIPGSCVEYVISVTNEGSVPATDIVVEDVLPPELEFSAAVVGDDFTPGTLSVPASGTDCIGGACTVNLSGTTLPAPVAPATASTGTVTIRAIVK